MVTKTSKRTPVRTTQTAPPTGAGPSVSPASPSRSPYIPMVANLQTAPGLGKFANGTTPQQAAAYANVDANTKQNDFQQLNNNTAIQQGNRAYQDAVNKYNTETKNYYLNGGPNNKYGLTLPQPPGPPSSYYHNAVNAADTYTPPTDPHNPAGGTWAPPPNAWQGGTQAFQASSVPAQPQPTQPAQPNQPAPAQTTAGVPGGGGVGGAGGGGSRPMTSNPSQPGIAGGPSPVQQQAANGNYSTSAGTQSYGIPGYYNPAAGTTGGPSTGTASGGGNAALPTTSVPGPYSGGAATTPYNFGGATAPYGISDPNSKPAIDLAAASDRAQAYSQGTALQNYIGSYGQQQEKLATGFQNQLANAYAPIAAGGGGYTPGQASAITSDPYAGVKAFQQYDPSVSGAIDDKALGLSDQYKTGYSWSPKDSADLEAQAAETVKQNAQGQQDTIQRSAFAAGNASPLAIASATDRANQTGEVAAANAATNARVAAKQNALQVAQTQEQTRLAAQQALTGAKVGAAEYSTTGATNAATAADAAASARAAGIANMQQAQQQEYRQSYLGGQNQQANQNVNLANQQALGVYGTELSGANTSTANMIRNYSIPGTGFRVADTVGNLIGVTGGRSGLGGLPGVNKIPGLGSNNFADNSTSGGGTGGNGSAYAKGGVVRGPVQATVGEAGPELIVDLDDPRELQMARQYGIPQNGGSTHQFASGAVVDPLNELSHGGSSDTSPWWDIRGPSGLALGSKEDQSDPTDPDTARENFGKYVNADILSYKPPAEPSSNDSYTYNYYNGKGGGTASAPRSTAPQASPTSAPSSPAKKPPIPFSSTWGGGPASPTGGVQPPYIPPPSYTPPLENTDSSITFGGEAPPPDDFNSGDVDAPYIPPPSYDPPLEGSDSSITFDGENDPQESTYSGGYWSGDSAGPSTYNGTPEFGVTPDGGFQGDSYYDGFAKGGVIAPAGGAPSGGFPELVTTPQMRMLGVHGPQAVVPLTKRPGNHTSVSMLPKLFQKYSGVHGAFRGR